LHLLGLLALWIGWLVSWRSSGRSAVSFMLAIAILTAYTYSASSHAADGGDFTLAELGDWLHVLSASAWGGGILASALFISILGKQPTRHRVAIGKMMGRLSSLSAAALALVLLTGVYNAALRLNGLNDLADTSYGQALGIKLILVAAMAVIGAVNRLIFVPKIRRWAAQTDAADIRPVRQIVASLGADVFLVLLILCAAAVLIQSMPPAVTKHTPGMSHPHSAQ
jgi:putative copper resistance protein D